jgi:acetyltransferase
VWSLKEVSAVATEPTEYPTELDDDLVLPNQRSLHIRALRRCEDGPIRELVDRLSPRTRYLRFLSPMQFVPDSVVRLLASVDYRRRLALVAEHETRNGREVVGMGSFGAVDDSSAEVALVVSDQWQQQGVGTELASRVLEAAEARGYGRFIVHMSSDNVAMRRLLRNVGEVVSAKVSRGVSELVFVRRRPTTV